MGHQGRGRSRPKAAGTLALAKLPQLSLRARVRIRNLQRRRVPHAPNAWEPLPRPIARALAISKPEKKELVRAR